MYAILLAAGLSTRMGCQKLLLPIGNSTMVEKVLDNLRGSGFSRVCAVFSQETDLAVSASREWLIRGINTAPERGQSSSLQIGLEMVPTGEDFCIMLGDLPFAQAADIRALREKFAEMPQDKTCMTPCRDGVFGHPMFYRSIWKKRLSSALGDSGGKKILLEYNEEILRVETPDGHFRDIDTPREYEASIEK